MNSLSDDFGRGQLHDIVKDYAVGLEAPDISQAAHRRLVNIFRERRPEKYGWDIREQTDDRLSRYVDSTRARVASVS